MHVTKVSQIGIVTDDLEKTIANYEKNGITEWNRFYFRPGDIPGMLQDGKPGDLSFDGALHPGTGFEIELIQPISDSIFKDFLKTHGPGMHHVAFDDDEDFDAVLEAETAAGRPPVMTITDDRKRGGFAYLDTFDELGYYVELHKVPDPEGEK